MHEVEQCHTCQLGFKPCCFQVGRALNGGQRHKHSEFHHSFEWISTQLWSKNWAPITGQVCKNRLSQPNFVALLGKKYCDTCTKLSNVTHANLGLSLAVFRFAGPRMVAKGIKIMNFTTVLNEFQQLWSKNRAPITGQVCKNRLSQPNFVAILGKKYRHTCAKSSNVTHANLGLSLAVFRLGGPRMVAKGIKIMSFTTVLKGFQHDFGAKTGPQLLGKCVKIDSPSRMCKWSDPNQRDVWEFRGKLERKAL